MLRVSGQIVLTAVMAFVSVNAFAAEVGDGA